MHVRVSQITRSGKTYKYAQLVESYRREHDGMPAHRVIANLGDPESPQVANMRAALVAARQGKRLVAATLPQQPPRRPTANLRYLDLAVLRSLWQHWQLDELLTDLVGLGERDVPLSAMICALAIQRCADPGSKLFATRWVPRTALPEILGFAPSSFNNTRVHRALDAVEECTEGLQAKLTARYLERERTFATLFVDVTDTWFVGHGPALAQHAKTKEGRLERKIGIVLLCNERGFPLRWDVVAGRTSDLESIGTMLRSVASLRWTESVPVVCDRAMGHTAQLRQMLDAKLHFVTALTSTEFEAYVPSMPWAFSAQLELPAHTTDDASFRREAESLARERAIAAGLRLVEDNLLVQDLGIVVRVGDEAAPSPGEPSSAPLDVTIEAMRHCREIEAALASGCARSAATAGGARGLSKGLTKKYRMLRALPDDVQRQILDGKAVGRSLAELLRIAKLRDAQAQRQAFAELLALASSTAPRRPQPHPANAAPSEETPARVRAVVYFNPQRFVDQRLHARAQLERIDNFVAGLNAALASPRSRMKPAQILAAVDRELRKDDLLDCFDSRLETHDVAGRSHYRVTLARQPQPWSRRRSTDGFSVVVAHPDVKLDGAALCHLYRAKDTVEKDFQIIKGLVELRPIHHRDEAKVRAHVTICMLALLLERTLEQRLDGLHSAATALELLQPTHLNYYAAQHGPSAYLLTETTDEQDVILRRLGLRDLTVDEKLLEQITPR